MTNENHESDCRRELEENQRIIRFYAGAGSEIYESGVREVPFHLLEKIADLFGCEAFLLFEDNVEADNEILATAFRISDVEEGDLKEIAHFKDLVKSYLKMERIGNGSK